MKDNMFAVVVSVFILNWILGFYLQFVILRKFKQVGLLNETSSRKSKMRFSSLIKNIISGSYRALGNKSLNNKIAVYKVCIFLQIILLAFLGFFLFK
jgi:hypothetical protein